MYSPAAKKRSGTGVRLRYKYGFKNEIGGKTGTTQNQSDGWFMGITPNLILPIDSINSTVVTLLNCKGI